MTTVTTAIPPITEDLVERVERALKEDGAVQETLARMSKYNMTIAISMERYSKHLTRKEEFLRCTASIYQLIEYAFDSEGEEMPETTSDTVDYVSAVTSGEFNPEKTGREQTEEIRQRIDNENPLIFEYIKRSELKPVEELLANDIAMVMYLLIEKQAIDDMKEKRTIAINTEEYETAGALTNRLSAIGEE